MQQYQKKIGIFNARCESATKKPFFHEGIRNRRVVIPATLFYEWDSKKTKYSFQMKDFSTLFMAGCCRSYNDGEHFVILTTVANSSMQQIHDRMPLILYKNEIDDWIMNNSMTDSLLRKISPILDHSSDFEQMSFL